MSTTEPKKGLFGRLFGSKPAAPVAAPDADQVAGQGASSEEALAREPDVASAEQAPAAPAEPEPAEDAKPEPQKVGWFQRLKSGLTRTSSRLAEGITGLVTKRKFDRDTLDELEDLLIGADLGVETSGRIIAALSKGRFDKAVTSAEIRDILAAEVGRVLEPVAKPLVVDGARKPHVVLVLGVNGSGKTTTIGKLAAQLSADGKRVMLGAGDTFRAAAIDQLKVWGERTGAPVVSRPVGSDASGLSYDALKEATDGGYDVLLLDTAGRLQNKETLMAELEKIVRVMKKIDPSAPHDTVLVLDATTGQNALSQVEVFRERAGVTGLVMTKLDGTARGGILVAIAAKYALPVHAIGVGEGVDDLQPFSAADFSRAICED
ncbi:MAG: signal recognition particle-docking protein FtsY [Hyphomicrobium sp.]